VEQYMSFFGHCFSELPLLKSDSAYWSSATSYFLQIVICSCHGIAETDIAHSS
jgi:hypothetical protein